MSTIEAGTYRARAVSAEIIKSKTKGTPGANVTFAILDGEWKNATIKWTGWLTEDTTERTLESLRHCGCTFPGEDIFDLVGMDGRDVSIVVEHEPWTNKNGEARTSAKVVWVNSLAGAAVGAKMADAEKEAFRARMKGALLMSKQAARTSGQGGHPLPAPENGAQSVDDLPF